MSVCPNMTFNHGKNDPKYFTVTLTKQVHHTEKKTGFVGVGHCGCVFSLHPYFHTEVPDAHTHTHTHIHTKNTNPLPP